MRKSSKYRIKAMTLGLALISPFTIIGGLSLSNQQTSADASYIVDYRENITITNNSFTEGANPYASGNLTGWTQINSNESKATGMIIDVGSTFSQYQQNTYMLQENPGKSGANSDNKILMINSKQKSDSEGGLTKKGYRSSTLTLKANSYYRFSVNAKTALNGSLASATTGSIYINGLKDEDGKEISLCQENFTNTSWKTYYFYLVTGDEEQEITIDLYLGSKTTSSDGGVVFFDEVYLEQYSQNAFYENVQQMQSSSSDGAIYLLDAFETPSSNIDMSEYNFDFEKEITEDNYNSLGDEWKTITTETNAQYGNAFILPVSRYTQASQFKDITKSNYNFVGNNLSYNTTTQKENSQALVLFSDNNKTTVYGVESKDIEIKAHGLYKFSVYVKVSDMTTGSFYITVKENDTIYETYKIDKDSYTTNSQSSEGISSNTENKFTNDYQVIDFYVQGHQFYDSSVNLQFWLGNSETPATGCVFIDDITLSYVDYAEFENATNKLELSSFSGEPTFTNAYFNEVENEKAELSYPIKASGWTLTQNDNANIKQQAGVVYLYDKTTYDNMYKDNYSWYGIFPGSPDKIDAPNNVYMFYNENKTYQNLKSSSYSLEANNYYKLQFNYFTSSHEVKDASLTIEIVDDNGITLFKQSGFSSENAWNKAEIYFHTAEQSSTNINVIIHFGEEDEMMQGIAYIDNFEVYSDISQTTFENADYKIDVTDYYLNLDPNGTIGPDITNSVAYSFSTDSTIGDSSNSQGGIVSGKENAYTADYGISIDDSNILVLTNFGKAKSTLTSNYKFNVEASSYYKLTFDLRTIFPNGTDDHTTDEHDCSFGVIIGIDGFNLISELKSENEFTTYTIYFKATSATTPTLQFSLLSDCDESLGSAFLTHINFTSATEDEYQSASSMDSYEKTTFTSTETDSSDEDTDEPSDDTTTTTDPENSVWLLIPSILFGIAIIIAILGYVLRKIDIKKVEKIRQETYDRKISVNHDLILREAQKLRDEEVKTLKEAKANLEKQKEELEIAHKESIKQARLDNKGKITKETEKAFKNYTSNFSRIQQKIEILQEQITIALKPDHLLELERKVAMDEEKRLKEMNKPEKDNTKADK